MITNIKIGDKVKVVCTYDINGKNLGKIGIVLRISNEENYFDPIFCIRFDDGYENDHFKSELNKIINKSGDYD